MPVFRYKALDDRGKSVTGMLDTETARTLRMELRKQALFLSEYAQQTVDGRGEVVQATGKKEKGSKEISFSFFNRVAPAEIAEMTRGLSTLLHAGVPLTDSLGSIAEQVEHDRLKHVMTQVRKSVNEGTALHLAIREHPNVFPDVYANMVEAGERSGTLELVFERLAEFVEAQVRMNSKVVSALVYPVIMIIVSMMVVTGLMIFVVPQMVDVIVEQGGDLPWITEALIAVSEVFVDFWWLIFGLFGVGLWGFKAWKRTPNGRHAWHRLVLRLPIAGRLTRKVVIARFSRTLGTLLSSGVPLLSALEIAKSVSNNAVYEDLIEDARTAIRDGAGIADSLRGSDKFPPMVLQMIAVGEKTGEVEQMLDRVAASYEMQADTTISRMMVLLEPFLILFLGGIVACIVFAILLPMLKMNEALRTRR